MRVVEVLRSMYDYVIVDLDKRLDDHVLDVIGMADRLIVVMTADLSCLKNVRLVLETMASLAIPDERLMLVLNRSNAFTGISLKSVENVLRRPIAQQIGNDYRSARRSWSAVPNRRSAAVSLSGRGRSTSRRPRPSSRSPRWRCCPRAPDLDDRSGGRLSSVASGGPRAGGA
jgi:MinD superfamily P-loop ATPase